MDNMTKPCAGSFYYRHFMGPLTVVYRPRTEEVGAALVGQSNRPAARERERKGGLLSATILSLQSRRPRGLTRNCAGPALK